MTPAGNFVVVWNSVAQESDSYYGAFAQRFDSSGTPLGGEFMLNTFTSGAQVYPAVAVAADGTFVVVWGSAQDGAGYGVFGARFDAAGAQLGVEFQVNVRTQAAQVNADVALDAGGGFVVVWQSNNQDGEGQGVFARRFDATGNAAGVEFQVNTYTTGNQFSPRIATNPDGDFVIAWSSPQDGGSNGAFARRFTDDLDPHGDEFQVNIHTLGNQSRPVPIVDDGGGFAVVWHDSAQDGSFHGVFGRRFDSTGAAETPEFQVNTYTALYQILPAAATNGSGDFVVVWQSSTQDGDTYGAFGQRFRRFVDFDVDGDGMALPLTDGLLILRYLFGFRGAVLISGAVGAGCTRCDAPSIEAFCEARL